MDIKLDISPEAIEQQIVAAVVKSGIGHRIESAVLSSINGYAFQRTVDEAAREAIASMVRTTVLENADLRQKVQEVIAAKLTEEHLNSLLDTVLQKSY